MKFNVVFIAGVHGVGKGVLSDHLSKKLSLPCFSASTLIKQQKKSPVDQDKQVIDPDKNQDLLIDALDNLSVPENSILLDGHFCLSATTGIIEVPISTFTAIPLKGIVLLTADPEKIYQRLLSRDGSAMNIDVIKKLQEHELRHAARVADLLNIPILLASDAPLHSVEEWVSSALNFRK